MRTRPFVLVAILALAGGCEHGIDVTGTVVAPPEVQALFSPENPGQLVIDGDLGGGASYTNMDAAVFCAATDRARRIAIRNFRFACAKAGTATFVAWVRPVPAGSVDCTGQTSPLQGPGPWDRQGALASGTTTAPAHVEDGIGACDDGSVTFILTLAPTAS